MVLADRLGAAAARKCLIRMREMLTAKVGKKREMFA
jgi:hypothetical protein